jgi:chitodextrinase
MSQYIPYPTLADADNQSAAWWDAVKGPGWQPGNVTQYLYGRRIRTGDTETDAELPDGVDYAIRIAGRDADLDSLITNDELEPREAGECAGLYPAWALGGQYAVGDLVSYQAALYKCRQAHTAVDAGWTPPSVPALWLVYRKDADQALAWVAGEPVTVGLHRTHGGAEYICLQAHVTQSDWTPPASPTLWQGVAPPTGEWAYPVAYKIGDRVTYQGNTYECRQAHTSQVGWTPAAVPALWLKL